MNHQSRFWAVMRRLTLVLAVGWLGGASAVAQTFHALIVADTKDSILFNACERDIEVMHRQLAQAASAIRYQLNEQVVSRDFFTRQQLDMVINRLIVQPDDIIFLYYSGHGYNLTGRPDRFPILMLEKQPTRLDQNPGLVSVHEQLKRKKARLCVTLSDCCNNIVTSTRGMVSRRALLRGLTLNDDSLNVAYRKLFLNTTGDVLIASSQPPQQSCAHPDSGSFYTRAFDEALDLASKYNRTISWETLLKDAQMRLTRHGATRDKRSVYQISQPGMAVVTTQFIMPMTPALSANDPASLAATPDFDRINQYLNELTDESLPEKQRYALLSQLTNYFTSRARIDIYVNSTRGEVQPIEQVVRRLYLNADHIQRINLIERLSALAPDGSHYERAAIQEVW